MKKILLIGNTRSRSFALLQAEADKQQVIFHGINSKNITIQDDHVTCEVALPYDLGEYDVYFFRGLPREHDRLQELQRCAAALKEAGKVVVEDLFTRQILPEDSFVPDPIGDEYHVPRTQCLQGAEILANPPGVPFVLKKLQSSQGKGVSKIVDPAILRDLVHPDESYLVQQFYEFTHDTRVFVVGDEVLGGLDRYRPEGEDFLTTRRGGDRIPAQLSDAQVKAAQAVARQKEIEIAGIDLFVYKGEVYIIEVNSSPQFFVFSKFTGINVAEKILAYLVNHP